MYKKNYEAKKFKIKFYSYSVCIYKLVDHNKVYCDSKSNSKSDGKRCKLLLSPL